MNYSPQYRLLQEGSGTRVSKTNIRPYGVYKISTYKYADGKSGRLAGTEETIIFVTGVYKRKVSALKLSNIIPDFFFKWFKRLGIQNKAALEGDELIGLYEIGKPYDIGGQRVYNAYVKSVSKFIGKGAAYRTYNLDGIQYASEIFFKKEQLNKYYG
jgi:hypothetical protein